MADDFVNALMNLRPNNLPSAQGKGHLSGKGKKGPRGKHVAPPHSKTKKPPKKSHMGGMRTY